MKRVLITGATGFIGGHLVERCRQAGYDVSVLARRGHAGAPALRDRGIRVFTGDIRDEAAVRAAAKGCRLVFHLAAAVTDWGPSELFRGVNLEGTRNLCRAALEAGVERFVDVSTSDVFGLREDVLIDESMPYRYWGEPYPDTKIDAARVVREYHERGLPATWVYPCWAYGPRDRTFLPLVADAIRSGQLFFWRRGALVWPSYVDNVVDLLVTVATHPAALGEGFIVHDGEHDTFEDLAGRIARHLGLRPPRLHLPYWSAMAAARVMETASRLGRRELRPLLTTYSVKNLGSRMRFSIDKARRLLDWRPPVSYAEGLSRSLAWLESSRPGQWKSK